MDPLKRDEISRIARQISSQSVQLKNIVDTLLRSGLNGRGGGYQRGDPYARRASEDMDMYDDLGPQIPTTTHISRRQRSSQPQVAMQISVSEGEPENPRPYDNDPVWGVWENNMLKLIQLLKMLLAELRNVSEYTMQDDRDAPAEEAYLDRVATSKLIGGYQNRDKVYQALNPPPPLPPIKRKSSRDMSACEQRSRQNLGEYFKRLAAQMDLLAETLKPAPDSSSAGTPMHSRLAPLEQQVGRMAQNISSVSKAIAKPVDPLDVLLATYIKAVSFKLDQEPATFQSQGSAAVSPPMASPVASASALPLGMMVPGMGGFPGMPQDMAAQAMARNMAAQAMAAQAMVAQAMDNQGTSQGAGAPGMASPGMMTPGMMMPPGMMPQGMMPPGVMPQGMVCPGMMAPGMMLPGMRVTSAESHEQRVKHLKPDHTSPLIRGVSRLTEQMQNVSGMFKEALGITAQTPKLTVQEEEEIRFCLDRLTHNMQNMTTDLRQTVLSNSAGSSLIKEGLLTKAIMDEVNKKQKEQEEEKKKNKDKKGDKKKDKKGADREGSESGKSEDWDRGRNAGGRSKRGMDDSESDYGGRGGNRGGRDSSEDY